MANINKNSHRSRLRKRKVKARVQDLRSRRKSQDQSIPLSESDRLSNRTNAESFMMEHLNDDDNIPFDTKEEFKVKFRYDLLFNTNHALEVFKDD